MKKEIFEKLIAFYDKNDVALGKKCSKEDIERLQEQLNLIIDSDLKDFLLSFGGSMVRDKEIYGCSENGNSEFMDQDLTLLRLNEDFRMDIGDEIKDWFIFGTDGSGNPIGIKEGKVVVYLFDDGEVEILSNSFEEYIEESL